MPANLRDYAAIAGELARAAPLGAPVTLAKLVYANWRYDLGPDSFFLFDLARRPMAGWRDYIRQKPHMGSFLEAVNGHPAMLARDKVLSCERCHDHGIAITPILAVTGRDRARFPAAGRFPMLADADAIVAAAAAWPDRVFIKPAGAGFGRGAMAATRDGAGWRDYDGAALTTAELAQRLLDPGEPMGILVQRRVANDPALAPIGGEYGLAATRVITALTDDGPEVLLAVQKIFGKPALADNYHGGYAGHLAAPVDLATGRLGPAHGRRARDRHVTARFDRHPRTGHRFAGFQLPHWPALVAQAKAIQAAFPEMPVLGHDLAITPDGPVFLETNANFKANLPQLALGGMRPVLERLVPRLALAPERKAAALATLARDFGRRR